MKTFARFAISMLLAGCVVSAHGKEKTAGQGVSEQQVTVVGIVNATLDDEGRCTEVFVADDKGVDHEIVLNDKGKALGKFNGKRVEIKGALENGKLSVVSFSPAGSGGKP